MYSYLIDNVFIKNAGEDYRLIKIRNEHDGLKHTQPIPIYRKA